MPVTKDVLLDTGRRLHADIRKRLTGANADFLRSLHDAEPDFNTISLPDALNLPAVQWKLLNLKKLKVQNPKKHALQRDALERLLY